MWFTLFFSDAFLTKVISNSMNTKNTFIFYDHYYLTLNLKNNKLLSKLKNLKIFIKLMFRTSCDVKLNMIFERMLEKYELSSHSIFMLI